jgi:predicted SnoaL-like aldol condensation-catalyzing enzyme
MAHTPSDIVHRYFEEIWNAGKVELIRTICTNPVLRHHPGRLVKLSHDQQIERISKYRAENEPRFVAQIRICEGPYVTTVWNGYHNGGRTTSAIEVFKVESGRISEVWNNTSEPGLWG